MARLEQHSDLTFAQPAVAGGGQQPGFSQHPATAGFGQQSALRCTQGAGFVTQGAAVTQLPSGAFNVITMSMRLYMSHQHLEAEGIGTTERVRQ